MWQMAMSADEIMAATGPNSGANSNRAAVPAASAVADDMTGLSVRTSPVAIRLNDRGGGGSRIAGRGVESITPSVAAVVATSSVMPAQTAKDKHTNRPLRFRVDLRATVRLCTRCSLPREGSRVSDFG